MLALAAAATSLGITAESVNGIACELFITTTYNESQVVDNIQLGPDSVCDLSISAAVIAVICLTVPTMIQLMKVVFGITK